MRESGQLIETWLDSVQQISLDEDVAVQTKDRVSLDGGRPPGTEEKRSLRVQSRASRSTRVDLSMHVKREMGQPSLAAQRA